MINFAEHKVKESKCESSFSFFTETNVLTLK